MFADRQAHVLSDERVVLRFEKGSVSIYGSPWVGSGEYAANSSAPLTALYVISHAQDRHRIARMPASIAVSRLLQQSFLPHWDRDRIERSLNFLISVVSSVPCRSLAFLKQSDLVDLVQQQPPVSATVPL
jgi:hypothetical protein